MHERKSVAQIVIETAPEPSQSLAFNYASEALNNGFFLDYLVSGPPRLNFVFSFDSAMLHRPLLRRTRQITKERSAVTFARPSDRTLAP